MTRNRIFITILILAIWIIAAGILHARGPSQTKLEAKWVYQELELLHDEGLLVNYPLEWVKSGNQLTRFEVAYYIKQLIVEKLESDQWRNSKGEFPVKTLEAIQKMIGEFREELADLGIKITNINNISPNLKGIGTKTDNYQDLDLLLSDMRPDLQKEPFYYMGQYISGLQRKAFVFVPVSFISNDYLTLFEGKNNSINVICSLTEKKPSFLVLKGNLPTSPKQTLTGYFLFPLESQTNNPLRTNSESSMNLNDMVLKLLDEINQIRDIDFLSKHKGTLYLERYLRLETDFQKKFLLGNLKHGLKIGGLFLCSGDLLIGNKDVAVENFGLPINSPRSHLGTAAVDLDTIKQSTQPFQINLQGKLNLTPQASLSGELDLLYRGAETSKVGGIWPSDTKASAGVQYQLNQDWSILTYQSFVNSQLKTGLLSTTSLGVEYNNWARLWFAYQFLDFDDRKVTGALSFRF